MSKDYNIVLEWDYAWGKTPTWQEDASHIDLNVLEEISDIPKEDLMEKGSAHSFPERDFIKLQPYFKHTFDFNKYAYYLEPRLYAGKGKYRKYKLYLKWCEIRETHSLGEEDITHLDISLLEKLSGIPKEKLLSGDHIRFSKEKNARKLQPYLKHVFNFDLYEYRIGIPYALRKSVLGEDFILLIDWFSREDESFAGKEDVTHIDLNVLEDALGYRKEYILDGAGSYPFFSKVAKKLQPHVNHVFDTSKYSYFIGTQQK